MGGAAWAPGMLLAKSARAVMLPRSSPEMQGVASGGVAAFLNGIAKEKHELHSFMVVRHGYVVAEGWWQPYKPALRHTMYSMSKSFTSTAVGLAVSEGKLTVEDAVTSFFPDDLPAKVDDKLAALKVKHLLSMASGHEKEPTSEMVKQENWAKVFLAAPLAYDPGTKFVYNSGATYMLSAIVQKVTGQKVIDYLTPRLFEPLVIEGMAWETCPRGINTGGWGLSVRTEDLAKFGQLYLQKGRWKGKALLPEKWVDEATTFKIQQPEPPKPTRPKEQNDWLQGYCYQFWRSQHHAFRGDGAFGQFTVVLPDKDAVVIMTGEDSNLQGELDLVWEHLLPAMKDAALPEDAAARKGLNDKLDQLRLPVVEGKADEAVAAKVTGKTFKLEANPLGLQEVRFLLDGGRCEFMARDEKQAHRIACLAGEAYANGETGLPGTPPRLISGGAPPAGTPFKVAGNYAWKDDKTLEMLWRYVETPHHDRVTCVFDGGGGVQVTFLNSIAEKRKQKDSRPVLVGRA